MTTPTQQLEVYVLKPGEMYNDFRRYCPIDGYELTSPSLTIPNGIVILASCPIDPLRNLVLTEIQTLAPVLFQMFSIHPEFKRQVDETIASIKTLMTMWITSHPQIPVQMGTFILDNVLDKMLYDQSKQLGLVKELATMPPQG